jgi:hypothetical protein
MRTGRRYQMERLAVGTKSRSRRHAVAPEPPQAQPGALATRAHSAKAEASILTRAHSSPAAAAAWDSGVSIDSGATWPS